VGQIEVAYSIKDIEAKWQISIKKCSGGQNLQYLGRGLEGGRRVERIGHRGGGIATCFAH